MLIGALFIHTKIDIIFSAFPQMRKIVEVVNCECHIAYLFQGWTPCPRVAIPKANQRRPIMPVPKSSDSDDSESVNAHGATISYLHVFIPNPPAKFLLNRKSLSFVSSISRVFSLLSPPFFIALLWVWILFILDAISTGWAAFQGVCVCNIITNERGTLEFAVPELVY